LGDVFAGTLLISSQRNEHLFFGGS